ncbi:50S ribosomal protein L10e [uncultured archaeon]|nr:50S ribosomal protein L10e [uncultured archaeon]
MGLRPAKCYRWDSPAYTRTSKNPGDSFITGIPGSKLIHYNMGNVAAADTFDTVISIVPNGNIILRHNALEAARIFVQKAIEKKLGVSNYFFKVRVFPHHVIRENVMATGAGADRVQSGMRQAFGKPMGRAARIRTGQPIFSIYFNNDETRLTIIKGAVKNAIKKLPGDLTITLQPSERKK